MPFGTRVSQTRLLVSGKRVRRSTERLKGVLNGSSPISKLEIKARNTQLKNILKGLNGPSELARDPFVANKNPFVEERHLHLRLDGENLDDNGTLPQSGQNSSWSEVLDEIGVSKYQVTSNQHFDPSKLENGDLVDDGVPMVSPILARDACKCPKCIDPSDRQRNFSYADIPTDIQYRSIIPLQSSGETVVHWHNDAPPHIPGDETIFDKATIANLKRQFRNPRWSLYARAQRLWDAASFNRSRSGVDFHDYMNESRALAEVLHILWRDGLAFIEGVPESELSVSQIVNRIGPLQNTFYGPTWDVRSVPDAKNVAYTSKYLGFHMDLLYMRDPPGFQFLHCVHNSCAGGESRFADTFNAVDKLYSQNPKHVRTLMKHPVRYEYDNDGFFYSSPKQTIDNKSQDLNIPKRSTANAENPAVMRGVEHVYWSPPFVGNLPSHLRHDELVDFISASKAFASILEQPENVVEEKMDSGTCVIFDNLRIVHARNAFDMNSGKRWLRGAYLNRQDFISKASALVDQMPAKIIFYENAKEEPDGGS